eukprot:14312914-Alexandrium_andersonii.AAC.1
MSASLVGSEMCIRDRLPPARVHGQDARLHGLRRCAGHRSPHGAQESPPPVSYTHLTLPTICSV